MSWYAGIDEHDRAEIAAKRHSQRRYQNSLTRHSDCRDPDHPGCQACEPDDFDDADDGEAGDA